MKITHTVLLMLHYFFFAIFYFSWVINFYPLLTPSLHIKYIQCLISWTDLSLSHSIVLILLHSVLGEGFLISPCNLWTLSYLSLSFNFSLLFASLIFLLHKSTPQTTILLCCISFLGDSFVPVSSQMSTNFHPLDFHPMSMNFDSSVLYLSDSHKLILTLTV